MDVVGNAVPYGRRPAGPQSAGGHPGLQFERGPVTRAGSRHLSRVRSLEPSRSPARGLSRRAEVRAGQAYRALMINLEELAATVASLGPAHRILEIGCGKGALATKLALAFPEA